MEKVFWKFNAETRKARRRGEHKQKSNIFNGFYIPLNFNLFLIGL